MWHRSALVAAYLSAGLLALPQVVTARPGEKPPTANIVNGVPTQDFPAVGALLQIRDDASASLFTTCTATLIGCETVLTAAHCFCTDDTEQLIPAQQCVRSGGRAEQVRTRTYFALQNAGAFALESVAIHPDFQPDPQDSLIALVGDVAVIKLASPVTGIPPGRVNTVKPVPLESRGTLVGFGTTDGQAGGGLKRRGAVKTVSCIDPRDGQTVENLVCWLFDEPIGPLGEDSDSCSGDSGGPLFVDFGAGPMVAGVTSAGTSATCRPPDLSWDAEVYRYRAWIAQQAGADLNSTRCGDGTQLGEAGSDSISFYGDVFGTTEDRYSVEIPPNTADLRFALNGEDVVRGSNLINQFGLVVNFGSPSTDLDYDCSDVEGGPYGFCKFTNPAPGIWYLAVPGAGLGSYQLTVTAFLAAPSPTATYTRTRTPTRVPTGTPPRTSAATASPSRTPIRAATPSATRTLTRTASPHPTATRTRTAMLTPTASATYSPTRAGTATVSSTPRATQTLGPCFGDCDDDGRVAINELILGVNIALGAARPAECTAFDPEGRGVTVDKLLRAINASLYSCLRVATPTRSSDPTDTVAASATSTESATPMPTETEAMATNAPTQTPTQANSATATVSETPTLSPTPLPTAADTATATAPPTPSETATATATLTPTCSTRSQTTPVEVARSSVPAGGYSISSSQGEFELAQLATTILIQSECEEVFVKVTLGIFSDHSECLFPGCTVNVRLSTSDSDDVVAAFGVGDPNHVRTSELNRAYTQLAPGTHTFRVSMTLYGMTWVPSGYLEVLKR